jgi:hypothetical protein
MRHESPDVPHPCGESTAPMRYFQCEYAAFMRYVDNSLPHPCGISLLFLLALEVESRDEFLDLVEFGIPSVDHAALQGVDIVGIVHLHVLG